MNDYTWYTWRASVSGAYLNKQYYLKVTTFSAKVLWEFSSHELTLLLASSHWSLIHCTSWHIFQTEYCFCHLYFQPPPTP